MGETRVIYSDATTAEAASVLKSRGFLESNQGGVFTSPAYALKVYVVWGRGGSYPELLGRLDFPPRIQVHLKAGHGTGSQVVEIAAATIEGLRSLSPGTRLRCFNPVDGSEL